MHYFYDDSGIKGCYGNRIWITKEAYSSNNKMVQFLKLCSCWGNIDKEDNTLDLVSFELPQSVGINICELIDGIFTLSVRCASLEQLGDTI